MKKIATDTYTLSKLIEGGFTYVDMTGAILPLADNSICSQFFCARPRKLFKVGCAFDWEKRNLGPWIVA